MRTLNIITFLSTLVLLGFLIKAVVTVIKERRKQARFKRNSEKVRSEIDLYKSKGLKEFKFGPKKDILIMAPDYKRANAEYQKLIKKS